MIINQIFRDMVPKELILLLLSKLNIDSFEDNKQISYKLIDDNIDEVKIILEDIKEYYLPCKSKIYFYDLNNNSKKIITIIRHLLKLYDYKLESKEKYSKEDKIKYIEFTIRENKKNMVTRIQTNLVLSFN